MTSLKPGHPPSTSFDAPWFLCSFPPKWTRIIEWSLAHCSFSKAVRKLCARLEVLHLQQTEPRVWTIALIPSHLISILFSVRLSDFNRLHFGWFPVIGFKFGCWDTVWSSYGLFPLRLLPLLFSFNFWPASLSSVNCFWLCCYLVGFQQLVV